MKEIILAKYGEIILKGGNRPKFENILMNNIRNSLKNVAEVKARLAQATIYVEVFDEDKMDIVVERLSKIFGIVSITRAVVCEKVFRSWFSCSPKRIVSEGASFSVVITSRRSFSFSIFSEVGMLTVPSRHKREITNLG